ncbi:hypothetical protein J6590_099926 [Homalodisca vitripennis]|nr:hypothetical protein J6590_099926 [Homalodisca vitripennis]
MGMFWGRGRLLPSPRGIRGSQLNQTALNTNHQLPTVIIQSRLDLPIYTYTPICG